MGKIFGSMWALALAMSLLLCGPDSLGAVKPQWVRQGEEVMNRKRIGGDYTFKVFHTRDTDLTSLTERRFDPLLSYVRESFGADVKTMRLDVMNTGENIGDVTYRVSFRDASGEGVVYARIVDEYSYLDDYGTNDFGFEFYQLFAVSDRNVLPVFDDFKIVENDNRAATALSVIPGAGQIYKGETLKGFGIMGTEAVLAAGAVVSHIKYNDYQKNADNGVFPADSWHSKATSCKVARNIMAGAFAGVWIYNILDAALLPGGSRVLVRKPQEHGLTLAPSDSGAGLAVVYRF